VIIKIDHIALTYENIENIFLKKGYKLSFNEKIKNPEIKKKLMRKFTEEQNIKYFTKEKEIPIEIINYNHSIKGKSKIIISDDGDEKSELFTREKYIIWKTTNLEQTINLFKKIGFKENEKVIKIKTFFNEINIKLEEWDKETYLDSSGFNCIAFLCKDIKKIKEKIQENFLTTDITEILVNKNKLNIFFAYNKNNDYIEFIEIIGGFK